MKRSVRPHFGLLVIGDEILSSKRQDRHLSNLNALLKPRGLSLSWFKVLGDDASLLVDHLKQSFASGHVVFCCGGIGATPDDRTRQSAAQALGLPLIRHPEALAEIEAKFGDQAYPNRVRMADFPEGAAMIPNFFNRVAGFSIQQHYFMPGFPQMTQPMMEWVLNTYYADLSQAPRIELAVKLVEGMEADWIDFMESFEQRFPQLRLFSLPHIAENGARYIELGVEGEPDIAQAGMDVIMQEIQARNQAWLPLEKTQA
ncbi:competence/damage-inducible protein A [Thiomicrospira microaerophila]|uniref:competence/damage-inducible protein A n=1 Tax=Thiomicrospira microaerophila TaxID=406020 RepID=UPI00200E69C0|nr:competence/damage-inducible protein A [Thiomicrospira microaerophila]UQB42086.1 competence/damage-inducible protein A [Thiomicrospira microaerophila]